jgi:hypothetical protein
MRNRFKKGIRCCNFCLNVLLVFISFSTTAVNYYISNTGDDSNPGTSESLSWKTILKVNASIFKAGDSILFRKGDTWRDQLTLPSGGSSDNYIIYGSYGTGDKPRILGSETETAWTNVSGNIWESTKNFTDPYALNYKGAIYFIENDGSVSWGRVKKENTYDCVVEYDWTWASNHIYIYSPTNPNTRYIEVEITQRNDCINLNDKEYVTIDGFEIAYPGFHGIGEKWPETNLTGLLIQNCYIHHLGVKDGAGYGIEAWHSNTLIRNNEIHDSGRRNISLNLYGDGATVNNITVENNILYNAFHTTGIDIATDGSSSYSNITFRYNYVYNELESDIDNIEVFGSGWAYCGAQLQDNTINDVYFYYNVFKGTTSKVSIGNGYGPNNVNFHNNLFYGVSPHITGDHTSFVLIQDGADVDFKNNIFYNDVEINENPTLSVIAIAADAGTVTLNNNLYYNTSATRLMIWYGKNYPVSQFEAFQSETGQDVNSILNENPLFVSSTDFHLQENSPAIDAGIDVGLTNDFEKKPIINAPDIGAYEWQKITRIKINNSNNFNFNLYPNPANEKVTLKFSDIPEGGLSIFLSDIAGNNLMKHDVNSLVEILDIQALPSGIYFIMVSGKNSFFKKLLIN